MGDPDCEDGCFEISVCMTTYNGEPFLETQISSILEQLGPRDEVVISDNGSSDGTLAFVRSLKDDRIRLMEFHQAKGPVPNFANALAHALKPVLILCDQDDIWLPNRIQIIRRAFQEHGPGILCLVTDGHRIDASGQMTCQSNLDVLGFRTGLIKNCFKNSYMGCCMAFSRTLLSIALPFPNRLPMHDSWIGLLAECFGTVNVIREPSYKYRIHGNNLSQKKNGIGSRIRQRMFLFTHLIGRILVAGIGRWARVLGGGAL